MRKRIRNLISKKNCNKYINEIKKFVLRVHKNEKLPKG
jgi:hypothetical protein